MFDEPRSGEATFPGGNGKIAYIDSCRRIAEQNSGFGQNVPPADQNFDIFTSNLDGSETQRITDDDSNDFNPAWSPGGGHIAFTRQKRDNSREIWVVDADGSQPRQLTALGYASAPDWSPDGTSIVFLGLSIGHGQDVYVMNSDGSNIRNLTNLVYPDQIAFQPVWSPDGSKIAFLQATPTGPPDIWLMNPDGSAKTNVTNTPDSEAWPDWSPDGSQLIFVRLQDNRPFQEMRLYVMNSDGSGQRKFSDHFVERAMWSPDGTTILFETRDSPDAPDGWFTMNLDGAGVQPALPSNRGLQADWQPLPPDAEPSESVVADCLSGQSPAPTASTSPATPSADPGNRTAAALPRTGREPELAATVGWAQFAGMLVLSMGLAFAGFTIVRRPGHS